MASGAYSFIDVAVLDAVRRRFVAGAALAVVDAELERVLWANGAGAVRLGHADIASALGAPSGLSALARRQIASARGMPGRLSTVAVRLGGGLSASVAMIEAGRIELPNGEDGMLLVLAGGPADTDAARSAALEGFAQSGFLAALVDGDGAVVADSGGFAALGIDPAALARLAAQVGIEEDRLVKRPVAARDGLLPAGIARLSDEPALNLVLAIDEPMDQPETAPAAEPVAPAPAPKVEPATPAVEAPAPRRIARFVWRTDEEGRFVSFSDSLAEAVGSAATDILGLTFEEAAARLSLDGGTDIPALLARRDTWSGRSVLWPVAGTGTRVPVDLAALPIYDRARRFEGFRGFGVVRLDEPVEAPHGVGTAPDEAPVEPEQSAKTQAPASEDEPTRADPFAGEPPALHLVPTPERRTSDKVIRLAEHRPPMRETSNEPLSPVERLAFREIGARLREAGIETSAVEEALSQRTGRDAPAVEPQQQAADELPADLPVPEEPVHAAPMLGPLPDREAADEALIAGLPVPALVHAGDVLHFANRPFLALTGHDDLEALTAAGGIDTVFVENEVTDGRLTVRRTDGVTRFASARLQSIGWQGGKALLLTLMPEPEPVQPPAPADDPRVGELEARLAELRTIVDTATDGVVVIAPNGSIRSISRAAEALFGLDSADVEGSPFANLFATESRRAASDYLAGLAGNGVASVLNDGREVIGREAQGRFIPLFMTSGRLPGDGGFCAVLRDITHWKRAEEELTQARAKAEKASSQKTDFLAHVSHEIRTPLNAIIGFSELMLDEKFGPVGNERYRDYLRDINRSGNHVLDLVNDLLDISKIEAGEQEMAYEAVSLNDALSETVAMMQPQANRERVIIRSSFASRLPDVVADMRSIRQIALNLLSNAVRHTPAGGQVIVSTAYESGGEVLVRIRDTGVGMSLGEIEQALKPFKQINAMKRGRGDGTGLGLPLTKALVEANRARFAISSTPSEGTLVEITFPSTRVLAD